MMRESAELDPHIVRAIRRIRGASLLRSTTGLPSDHGTETGRYKVIALTNNYASTVTQDVPAAELAYLGWQNGAISQELVDLFDDFCDSSKLGMRFVASSLDRPC